MSPSDEVILHEQRKPLMERLGLAGAAAYAELAILGADQRFSDALEEYGKAWEELYELDPEAVQGQNTPEELESLAGYHRVLKLKLTEGTPEIPELTDPYWGSPTVTISIAQKRPLLLEVTGDTDGTKTYGIAHGYDLHSALEQAVPWLEIVFNRKLMAEVAQRRDLEQAISDT